MPSAWREKSYFSASAQCTIRRGGGNCAASAAAEARILEHGQALVVIHREHAIRALQPLRHEERIGGKRAACLDAEGNCFPHRGGDDRRVLGAKMPGFAAVGVEASDQDPRSLYLETLLQIAIEHS